MTDRQDSDGKTLQEHANQMANSTDYSIYFLLLLFSSSTNGIEIASGVILPEYLLHIFPLLDLCPEGVSVWPHHHSFDPPLFEVGAEGRHCLLRQNNVRGGWPLHLLLGTEEVD